MIRNASWAGRRSWWQEDKQGGEDLTKWAVRFRFTNAKKGGYQLRLLGPPGLGPQTAFAAKARISCSWTKQSPLAAPKASKTSAGVQSIDYPTPSDTPPAVTSWRWGFLPTGETDVDIDPHQDLHLLLWLWWYQDGGCFAAPGGLGDWFAAFNAVVGGSGQPVAIRVPPGGSFDEVDCTLS